MMPSLVSGYFVLNLLLAAAFVFTLSLRRLGRHGERLRLNYWLLRLVFAAAALHFLLPTVPVIQPVLRLWAAPSASVFDQHVQSGVLRFAVGKTVVSTPSPADYSLLFIGGLAFGAALTAIVLSARDGLRLRRLRRRAFALRALGRVRVHLSEETSVPFSYRGLWLAHVVLPLELLSQPQRLRLCLLHELQHHRQGDTLWVYVLYALKCLCFWNPLVHAWMACIGEDQELACDEALVDHKRADPQDYARCLIEVAQNALGRDEQPVCATGLLFWRRRQQLSRRIASMFEEKKTCPWLLPVAGLMAAALLSATAYATKGLIQDRRITATQAQEWAKAAQRGSDFPIVVNEDVVRVLNRYLGTPEGREFIRNGLSRMQGHRSAVEIAIRSYGLPEELLAVPLIESGYQNLPERTGRSFGAGMWQFITQTARNYGLVVDRSVDQRLDVPLATDAALRYLSSNNMRFRDWQLALLGYNQGENKVQQCINATGSRDAWHLVRNGCEGDRDYLAKIMAAVLIVKNPSSVR